MKMSQLIAAAILAVPAVSPSTATAAPARCEHQSGRARATHSCRPSLLRPSNSAPIVHSAVPALPVA